MEKEMTVKESRAALISDLCVAFNKKTEDKINAEDIEVKNRIKVLLQTIADYNSGCGNLRQVDIEQCLNEIYEQRIRLNNVHIRREALRNTYADMMAMGFISEK